MSLPQSLSRSVILDAPGNLFLIHKFAFQLRPPFSFFLAEDESQERNQTSCRVYLQQRDKCGFASFRERALSMPQRERRVAVGAEEVSVCRERTAFTHLENCENVPFTPPAARAELRCC